MLAGGRLWAWREFEEIEQLPTLLFYEFLPRPQRTVQRVSQRITLGARARVLTNQPARAVEVRGAVRLVSKRGGGSAER